MNTHKPTSSEHSSALAFTGRALVSAIVILACWQLLVWLTDVPKFILPSPVEVLQALAGNASLLGEHAVYTLFEILAGMLIGSLCGLLCAIGLSLSIHARRWLLPVMVISQALPVFALAPLLTLWFGYGMSSKIVMASLITFFPVAAACYDGLRYTDDQTLELAQTMSASPWSILWQLRLPQALPAFASGLRVAASVAPIGAVVGEWVGSSHGLGYLMLHANGRMQTDVMFAALLILCLMALILYFSVNAALNKAVYWRKPNLSD